LFVILIFNFISPSKLTTYVTGMYLIISRMNYKMADCMPYFPMVHVVDDNLGICAHVCSEIDNLACFKALVKSDISHFKIIVKRFMFLFHACNMFWVTILYKYHGMGQKYVTCILNKLHFSTDKYTLRVHTYIPARIWSHPKDLFIKFIILDIIYCNLSAKIM